MSYKCTRRVASICEYLQVLTGTHRYLQVHEGEKGPKQPKVCLFFNLHLIFYFLYYYEAHKGPQQPTTANAGQRWPRPQIKKVKAQIFQRFKIGFEVIPNDKLMDNNVNVNLEQ